MTLNKPWLAQYPKSVPKTIDPDRYGSIMELYIDMAASWSSMKSALTAFVCIQ